MCIEEVREERKNERDRMKFIARKIKRRKKWKMDWKNEERRAKNDLSSDWSLKESVTLRLDVVLWWHRHAKLKSPHHTFFRDNPLLHLG